MSKSRKRPKINNAMGERIWQRIEELRAAASPEEAKSINPAVISKAAGRSATYIRDILQDHTPNPRIQFLQAIADELGVSLEWIQFGRDVDAFEPGLKKVIDWWGDLSEQRRRFIVDTVSAMRSKPDEDETVTELWKTDEKNVR